MAKRKINGKEEINKPVLREIKDVNKWREIPR